MARRVLGLVRRLATLAERIGLLRQFALLSLIPIALLGVALAIRIQDVIQEQALASAKREAEVIGQLSIRPLLEPADLHAPSTAKTLALDQALRTNDLGQQIARMKIWNRSFQVIYSTNHDQIGQTFPPSDELESALDGKTASEVSDLRKAENEADRSYGQLLEVYVPLRFAGEDRPVGAFEIYLPYQPIADAVARETRLLYLVILGGLALLYVVLLPIVAGASRRLRRQAEENAHQALHDSLTSLPNRDLFRGRVELAILAGRRANHGVSVMLMDLDHFKDVNDTLGHDNGDRLLVDVGIRLRETLRPEDTVARLGGDEFAVLLPNTGDRERANYVASKLLASLNRPFILQETPVEVGASVGIALYPEHGEDMATLLQKADVAMYIAKLTRGAVATYAAERDRYSATRLALISDLHHAIDRRELVLYYQPKIALPSKQVTGLEALVRWQHPQHGLLSPDEFIPLAEHTGLITPLTMHVLEMAIRQCRIWQDDNLRLTVAVNISARDLLDTKFPDKVARLLAQSGVRPTSLGIEITESTVMEDPARAKEVLERLSALGIRVAVDDFGTGYSSLSYLRQLPLNEIKIDKSFVINMASTGDDEVIVRSIIDLGRNLGFQVVAEGVETTQALDHLTSLGCDLAQGFLIGRPLPAAEVSPWLRGWPSQGGVSAAAA